MNPTAVPVVPRLSFEVGNLGQPTGLHTDQSTVADSNQANERRIVSAFLDLLTRPEAKQTRQADPEVPT